MKVAKQDNRTRVITSWGITKLNMIFDSLAISVMADDTIRMIAQMAIALEIWS